MKTPFFSLFLLVNLFFNRANAQLHDSDTVRNFHYVGFLFSADLSQNQKDNLFTAHPVRKLSIGISFTNRKKDFLAYLSGGFKGWKVSAKSPQFTGQFNSDVNQFYHPISGDLHDSLSAASVYTVAQNQKDDYYLFGFYAQYAEAGFVLTKYKLRPSVSFCVGWEDYVLFTPDAHFLDPNNESYSEWISMNSGFKEIKAGLDLLGLFNKALPFTLDINAGYKWINYKNIAFEGTPLSAYTNEQVMQKYNSAEKFTFGIHFRYWTNW